MSDVGNLSHCMMDGDAGEIGRARRLRGKALFASAFLELAVIAGMLLWPLVTPGVLPPQLVLTPVPLFHGAKNPTQTPNHGDNRPSTNSRHSLVPLLHQPLAIPHHFETTGLAPPDVDASGNSNELGDASLWIPGGGDGRDGIGIVRPNSESKPRKISVGVMDALLIHRVEPVYSSIARSMHLSGIVLLRATIGTDGEVRGLEVVSGNPILVQAALAAVRQWRYRPTLLNGEAVEVETQITVKFVLE